MNNNLIIDYLFNVLCNLRTKTKFGGFKLWTLHKLLKAQV
nr:MAG TPA: hypothetical protein [Caudoviricetes sp.]